MFWMVVSTGILIFCLLNMKKVNDMFNRPSAEELENYQESVFLHIDEEIENYKKEIAETYKNEGEPMVAEIKKMIGTVDERLRELEAIEQRIDEKIIKLQEYKNILS